MVLSKITAATTYDITKMFGQVSRLKNTIMIVSLLQPPPETVANFDEVIVLSEGMIIYNGPVAEVIDHFNSLGYEIPERMDVADWLQVREMENESCALVLLYSEPHGCSFRSSYRHFLREMDGGTSRMRAMRVPTKGTS
jgi:ABC-type multidrug transport system ATPase subunit